MYPQAYLDYLVYFHAERDYFECHEVLEEYWKEKNLQETHWVALIQLAVGLYHQRRGNVRGATRMLQSSLKETKKHPAPLTRLGIKPEQLANAIEQRLFDMQEGISYTDFSIPLISSLEATCQTICNGKGLDWNAPSPDDSFLIHKHTLRDRSDVIQERERQKQLKKERKKGD